MKFRTELTREEYVDYNKTFLKSTIIKASIFSGIILFLGILMLIMKAITGGIVVIAIGVVYELFLLLSLRQSVRRIMRGMFDEKGRSVLVEEVVITEDSLQSTSISNNPEIPNETSNLAFTQFEKLKEFKDFFLLTLTSKQSIIQTKKGMTDEQIKEFISYFSSKTFIKLELLDAKKK